MPYRAICSNRDQDTYITAPKYDAYSGKALDSDKHRFIPPVSILIVEGDVLSERGVMPSALHPGEDIAAKLETVYLHVPDAARLERRLRRDMEHRNGHGETPEVIARNFESRQRTQHLPYTLRYAAVADYIVQPNARVDQHYDVARLRPTPSA
ncbi:MAG TPA: hypothetical protein VLF43_05090 [Candidatus Saccharimonadales bacterium]|nr:hypothetical protein [Candidatus Saccharimonadales bacterium]